MDNRDQVFKDKFADAAKQLGVSTEQVLSLKLRENVGHYHEYTELLDTLQRDGGIHHSPVSGRYLGNAHLVGNARTKIIVVEHETGLEILFIAGSVASIVSLVPLVLQFWRAVRGHFMRPHHFGIEAAEIRRIDSSGRLVEEMNHALNFAGSESLAIVNKLLLAAAEKIDGEIRVLNDSVESLAERVNALEKKSVEKAPTKARRLCKGAARKKRRA